MSAEAKSKNSKTKAPSPSESPKPKEVAPEADTPTKAPVAAAVAAPVEVAPPAPAKKKTPLDRPDRPQPVWIGKPAPPSDFRMLRSDLVTWSPVQLLSAVRKARHELMAGRLSENILKGYRSAMAIYWEELSHRYPGKALAEFASENWLDDISVDDLLAVAKKLK